MAASSVLAVSVLALSFVLLVPQHCAAQLRFNTGDFTANAEVVTGDGAVVNNHWLAYASRLEATLLENHHGAVLVSLLNGSRYQWTWPHRVCTVNPPPAEIDEVDIVAYAVTQWLGNRANASNVAKQNGTFTSLGVPAYLWQVGPQSWKGCDVTIRTYMPDTSWIVQGIQTSTNPLSLDVALANCAVSPASYRVTVADFVPAQFSAGSQAFKALGTCDTSLATTNAPPPVSGIPPAIQVSEPFPALPSEFRAVVKSTRLQDKASFTVGHTFSEITKRAHVGLFKSNSAGHMVYGVYVNGESQLAYQVVTPLNRDQWYEGHNHGACEKSVFNERLITTTKDLLLVSDESPPRYYGRSVTRGIPVKRWTAVTALGAQVMWHFSEASLKANGNASSQAVLVRMTVRGTGRSPMFVHHPFLQRGQPVEGKLKAACTDFLPGFNQHCAAGDASFAHNYDFFRFSTSINSALLAPPSQCDSGDPLTTISAFPEARNCPEQITPLGLFGYCLLSALVGGLVIGIIFYFHLKGRVQKMQREIDEAISQGVLPPPQQQQQQQQQDARPV